MDDLTWATTAEPACDMGSGTTLYNGYAIADGPCPSGWKVPAHDDFVTLHTFLSSASPYSQGGCSARAADDRCNLCH